MFRVTHTTPKKVMSHLLRLQREGEALLLREELNALAEGMWADRVFRYLKKISVDPDTFERLMWIDPPTVSLDFTSGQALSVEERSNAMKKHVQKHLITLVGAIEQFEAHYEE